MEDQNCSSVLLLSKPSADFIHEFLLAQACERFSYAHVGASRRQAPRGYVVDHNRVQLGSGTRIFETARKALCQWKMFDMPWLSIYWPGTPIKANETVAVLISHAGFWSLNACRIVYVLEEHGACERYGFAYGTLRQHGERGEECFAVEFHADDQSVWYDVYAFSRPSFMAALAYPYVRTLQRRFARYSIRAMKKAVEFV
ncbi:MAG: DUF1990 domain-containing protein [Candidatus Acidiferrales bacterium]